VRLFAASACFGIAIAVTYFYLSHEVAGTFLLGVMGAGLLFAAGYALLAERDAALDGDSEDAVPGSAAGEDLGVFTTRSAWPILIAAAVLLVLLGVLWSPGLAALAFVALIVFIWRLGRESNRT
jgi:hypothetical protein